MTKAKAKYNLSIRYQVSSVRKLGRLISVIYLLLVTCYLLLGLGSTANASSQGLQGITVSPAFQMVNIEPGAAEQKVSFTITNNQPTAQSLSFSVQDFNTLNDSGGLFFVGTNPTDLQKKYGRAKWFSLPTTHLSLGPKQTYQLNGSVLNLPTLNPGGHYGALMIAIDNGGNKSGQVGLHPIASSLMFVTKPEGATHNLSLSGVELKRSLTHFPSQITLRFQNIGNTHLVPRGIVTIFDQKNKLISRGIINQNSAIILPETYRRYDVPLTNVANFGIGKYTALVDFRFDGIDQYRRFGQSFYYVPLWMPIVPIFVIAGLIGLLLRKVINNLFKKAKAQKT